MEGLRLQNHLHTFGVPPYNRHAHCNLLQLAGQFMTLTCDQRITKWSSLTDQNRRLLGKSKCLYVDSEGDWSTELITSETMDLDALFSYTSNVYLLTGIICLVSAFYLWYR